MTVRYTARQAAARARLGEAVARIHVRVVDGPWAGRTLAMRPPIVSSFTVPVTGEGYRIIRVRAGYYAIRAATDDPHTPIIAWRAWDVDDDVIARPVLVSKTRRDGAGTWPNGMPLVASCRETEKLTVEPTPDASDAPREVTIHTAPVWDCTCGVYATRTLHGLRTLGYADQSQVYGLVALWGRVLLCADGYRAQRAYPLALLVHVNPTELWGTLVPPTWRDDMTRMVRSLARMYRVPVAAGAPELGLRLLSRAVTGGMMAAWTRAALPDDLAITMAGYV